MNTEEIPVVGSLWTHRTNDTEYSIVAIANRQSTRSDYVLTVVYKDRIGNIWCRPFSEWHRSFAKKFDFSFTFDQLTPLIIKHQETLPPDALEMFYSWYSVFVYKVQIDPLFIRCVYPVPETHKVNGIIPESFFGALLDQDIDITVFGDSDD